MKTTLTLTIELDDTEQDFANNDITSTITDALQFGIDSKVCEDDVAEDIIDAITNITLTSSTK